MTKAAIAPEIPEHEKWANVAAYHRERQEYSASRLAAQVSDAMRFYAIHLAALERGVEVTP